MGVGCVLKDLGSSLEWGCIFSGVLACILYLHGFRLVGSTWFYVVLNGNAI